MGIVRGEEDEEVERIIGEIEEIIVENVVVEVEIKR